jgi:hypothetical protein
MPMEQNSRDDFNRAAKAAQKQIGDVEKKIGDSVTDAVAAYQEWLSEEMTARSEDARRFMSNSQSFMSTSSRAFSNGWSGMGMNT